MPISIQSLLAFGFVLVSVVVAQAPDPALTGTWSTKSNKVITGPVRVFFDCEFPSLDIDLIFTNIGLIGIAIGIL